MLAPDKFLSTTLREKYIHKQMVLAWVLHLNPLYPNFTYPTSKKKLFNTIKKPKIYVRNVDIFTAKQSHDEINKLKETYEKNSVKKFIIKLNINKKKKNSLPRCPHRF